MADSDNESGGGHNASGQGGGEFSSPREQDRFLPIANVSRIMKKSLPANAKISKDAKETVQECVSEFISFITGEASDKCQREKRKTVNGDDLLWAMTTLGFEEYVEPLKVYLQKFREMEGEKTSKEGGGGGNGDESGGNVVNMGNNVGGYGGGMYVGGGGMMMGQQQMYGSSPPASSSSSYHLQHRNFGGSGASGGGGGNSTSGGIGSSWNQCFAVGREYALLQFQCHDSWSNSVSI